VVRTSSGNAAAAHEETFLPPWSPTPAQSAAEPVNLLPAKQLLCLTIKSTRRAQSGQWGVFGSGIELLG